MWINMSLCWDTCMYTCEYRYKCVCTCANKACTCGCIFVYMWLQYQKSYSSSFISSSQWMLGILCLDNTPQSSFKQSQTWGSWVSVHSMLCREFCALMIPFKTVSGLKHLEVFGELYTPLPAEGLCWNLCLAAWSGWPYLGNIPAIAWNPCFLEKCEDRMKQNICAHSSYSWVVRCLQHVLTYQVLCIFTPLHALIFLLQMPFLPYLQTHTHSFRCLPSSFCGYTLLLTLPPTQAELVSLSAMFSSHFVNLPTMCGPCLT